MDESISIRKIDWECTVFAALQQMDRIDKKLLLVFEGSKFLNVLSIGDIQRAILNNKPLDTRVIEVVRKQSKIARVEDSLESIKDTMRKYRIECMPVINQNNDLEKVYFWNELFGKEEKIHHVNLGLPVVIMAGGKGTRMKPLTNVIPKPLIPIGENTIIEEIMNRFLEVGCDDFFLSVNYKADTIKHYFDQEVKGYKISYFQEDKPLGTAGSLFLIKDKIKSTFFVSNCDIIVDDNYLEIINYHRNNKNELTIVSALKQYPIPYGTIETNENGVLSELKEKPNLTFQINTGFYILEPHLLDEIPENKFFHITHLIEQIKERGGKVGVFPVSEGSWKDIGQWDEYIRML